MAEALRNHERVGTSLAAMVAETEAAIDSMGDTPVAEALPDKVGGVLDSLKEKFKVLPHLCDIAKVERVLLDARRASLLGTCKTT